MLSSIQDRRAAGDLAEQIVDIRRATPLIVVTAPSGRTESFVPVDRLNLAIGSEADIAFVSSRATNWLSDRLTELGHSSLHVYGGATRLYPAGSTDDASAPVFTARTNTDGERVLTRLRERVAPPRAERSKREPKSWKQPAQLPQESNPGPDADAAAGLLQENRDLRVEVQAGRMQIEQLTRQLSEVRQRSSKARKRDRDAGATAVVDRPSRFFLDAGEDIRYRIQTSWAEQVPAEQKDKLPLAMFTLGDDFSASVEAVAGADATLRDKIARACVRVLTRQDRDTHKLGEERDDGATAWRSYVEQKSPSARRLHYWAVPGGAIELARVVLHDDYRI